jgi:hypothetical protein
MAYGDQVDAIVTWEWLPIYALRNTIYPFYLSLPLHILRFLRIDSNFMVVNSMAVMNSIIQVVGDYFSFCLAERLMGKRGAVIFTGYSVFNRRINEIF